MVLGGAVAACSGGATGPATGDTAAATAAADMQATMAPGDPAGDTAGATGAVTGEDLPTADEIAAGWAARPAFVASAAQRTQAAYAFSLARPDLLRFLPCYCGCVAMEHRSNLDCFIKPGGGSPVAFEEHASFCDICVDIALKAQDMLAKGNTLIQMRAAVDSEFGGRAPGTQTELPPA
jgi:hypothetical protein